MKVSKEYAVNAILSFDEVRPDELGDVLKSIEHFTEIPEQVSINPSYSYDYEGYPDPTGLYSISVTIGVSGIDSLDGVKKHAKSCREELEFYTDSYERPSKIKVGDEVRHKKNTKLKIYVTDVDLDGEYFGGFALANVFDCCCVGDRYSDVHAKNYEKTGKHYPTITELLKDL